jgi:hypothetical protein
MSSRSCCRYEHQLTLRTPEPSEFLDPETVLPFVMLLYQRAPGDDIVIRQIGGLSDGWGEEEVP